MTAPPTKTAEVARSVDAKTGPPDADPVEEEEEEEGVAGEERSQDWMRKRERDKKVRESRSGKSRSVGIAVDVLCGTAMQ